MEAQRDVLCIGKHEPVWNILTAQLGSVNFPNTHRQAQEIPGQVRASKRKSHLRLANTTPGLVL